MCGHLDGAPAAVVAPVHPARPAPSLPPSFPLAHRTLEATDGGSSGAIFLRPPPFIIRLWKRSGERFWKEETSVLAKEEIVVADGRIYNSAQCLACLDYA